MHDLQHLVWVERASAKTVPKLNSRSNICSQFFHVSNNRAILSQICSPLCTPNLSVRKKRATWMEDGGARRCRGFFSARNKTVGTLLFLLVWQILRHYWRGGYFPCLKFFLARSQYTYVGTRKLSILGDALGQVPFGYLA